MKKKLIAVFAVVVILFSLASCAENGGTDGTDYTEQFTDETTQEQKSLSYDISKVLNIDNSWQKSYALSYSYYDSKKSKAETKIAEGKTGNYYQSLDYSSGIVTFLSQQNGYMTEYMLNNDTMTGTETIVTDSTVDDSHSGFTMLSTCDPYLPVYTNVTRIADDYVAKRAAVRYKQTATEDGKQTKIAYIWIDDEFSFASKCELYDAQTQQLIMRWELLTFTQQVDESKVKVDISKYKITSS